MAVLGQALDGRSSAKYHEELIRKKLDQWENRHGTPPEMTLATVQIGKSADIELYSKHLGKALSRFGIRHVEKKFTDAAPEHGGLMNEVLKLYRDPSLTGVMIFSPLPASVDGPGLFMQMPLDKDIEGRTFMKRNPFGVFSPTAKAVLALLRHLERADKKFMIAGKHAVMVGHSDLVGKPTAALLLDAGATVTVCHKDTQDLLKYISDADILVVAIGRPRFVQGSWVKEDAVVIDVGENAVEQSVVGDVDFEGVRARASYVTPVPGGIGPLTNLMVVENLLMLHEYKALHGNH